MHHTWDRSFCKATAAIPLNAQEQATVRGIRSCSTNKMITSTGSVYIKQRWIGRIDSVVNEHRASVITWVRNKPSHWSSASGRTVKP